MYESLAILQVMIETLGKLEIHAWPKELKRRLRIPFAEYHVVARTVYYRDRLVIDQDDANI
jgi:hypothetical protein